MMDTACTTQHLRRPGETDGPGGRPPRPRVRRGAVSPALAGLLVALALPGCRPVGDDDATSPLVSAAPEAPFVEILQPVPTGDYKVGEDIPLKAQATDADTDVALLELSWRSSLDGVLSEGAPDGEGEFSATALLITAGDHTIEVEAVDPSGLTASASLTISVADLEPPRAVLDPAPTGTLEGDTATITGTVSDAEDAPTDLFVQWQVDGINASGTQPNASGKITLVTDALRAGVHQISVLVTDQDGRTGSARVDITVTACPDVDRDGFPSCAAPGDDVDCDDRDEAINPDEDEICGDGADQDCDGDVDEGFADTDNDTVPDCVDECPEDRLNDRDGDGLCADVDNCPTQANADQVDLDEDGVGDACDDLVSELCDGVDNDSDGATDEDFATDADLDGVIDCLDPCPLDEDDDGDQDQLCADVDNCPDDYNPDQEDLNDNGVGDACDYETCDGEDNDRDGLVDEDFDQDQDGYATCAVGGKDADCDDTSADFYPGPAEICGDGKDNDCDLIIDRYADQYEPNNSLGTAIDLGLRDDESFDLYATVYRADGTDSDFYKIIVDDDFAVGPDQFVFTAELSQVPAGLNLQLFLYYGTDVADQSDNPGGEVQSVIRYGVSGPDDDAYPYVIEVRNLGGSTLDACGTYHLWVSNQG